MTSIRITTLANGLRIASDRMPHVETVSIGVWIAAGSRYESATINGASHFLEHMVFKGTRRRDARAIAEEIESVGGHLNAHTSREYTAFYAKVLKDDWPLAMDVIADMLQDAVLDQEELGRERTVVIQEILQALDTPDDIIFDRFQETAFPRQPLGRPVLGLPELIEGISREQLLGYMRANYGGPRMIVAAAGNIDHDALVACASRLLDHLSVPANGMPETACYGGGCWKEQRDLEQVHMVLGFESVGFQDERFHAVSLLSTLMGGGMSSRLFQEAREKRGLVYSIYTFAASYTETGLFGVYAGTGEKEVEELVPLICSELKKVRSGIGESELGRARAQLKSGILMALESTSARCEQLARQLMVFGRPIPVAETVAKIDAVTSTDVERAASSILAQPPVLAVLGPPARVPRFETVCDLLR